mgnify:CR=1 FL=1
MAHSLHEFVRRKPFLLCVDSDGCAMDTMNIKHFRCFGPCFADEWGLGAGRDAALNRWNEINLFSMTRGVNRFLGLAHILTELFPDDQDVAAFSRWTQSSKELSERAVEAHAAENPVFSKALAWSRAVNKAIGALTDEEKTAFGGVREVLEEAHKSFDIAVVSSANYAAVEEEWARCGLLAHVDVLATQQDGSKAHCIAELLKKGYAPQSAVMCGDAPGDERAAAENGVHFYPILVRDEEASWEALPAFLDLVREGNAEGEEACLKAAFFRNLGGN